MFKHLLLAVGLIGAPLCAQVPAHAAEFEFVALGDMPYGVPAKVNPLYEALIDEINKKAPAFLLHVGDTKSGSTVCDDAMLDTQLGYLNSFDTAVLYAPGDNEWTDCYRAKAGGFDPLERLDYIRKTYFADPATSFGKKPVAVQSQALVMADTQSTYVENARMMHEGVMVMTAHVLGSNNNFEVRDPKAATEFFARDKANVAWLEQSFDLAIAENAAAVVVAIQADMFEFDFNSFGREGFLRHSGFLHFGKALVKKAVDFGKPVLLVYGDSHIFRVTRPFPKTAPNITGVEVFGAKDMHAVRVRVDTEDLAVFGFAPVYNPAQPIRIKN
jgi:hypothetical protein